MAHGDLGDYDQQLLYLKKALDVFSKALGKPTPLCRHYF